METSGSISLVFFFNATATPAIYTLPLHDALPIFLCNCKGSADLAKKMADKLLLTHENRNELRKNGRRQVEEKFSQDIVCQLFFDTIKGCYDVN